MTKADLKHLAEVVPFQPLRIHMVDGKEMEIPHPDHLFFVPGSEMIFVVANAQGRSSYRFLTPDQIASVER